MLGIIKERLFRERGYNSILEARIKKLETELLKEKRNYNNLLKEYIGKGAKPKKAKTRKATK